MIGTGTDPTDGKCSVHGEPDWGTVGCYGREWDPPVSGYFFWDNQKQQGACKLRLLIVAEQIFKEIKWVYTFLLK